MSEGGNTGRVAIATAIIGAVGGWGSAAIAHWVSSGDGGAEQRHASTSEPGPAHPTPKPQTNCESMQGQWRREDGVVLVLNGSGCVLSGYFKSDKGVNSQTIHVTVSGKKAIGYIRRVVSDCPMILGVDYELLARDQLRIQAQGSGCDLKDYSESYIYSRTE